MGKKSYNTKATRLAGNVVSISGGSGIKRPDQDSKNLGVPFCNQEFLTDLLGSLTTVVLDARYPEKEFGPDRLGLSRIVPEDFFTILWTYAVAGVVGDFEDGSDTVIGNLLKDLVERISETVDRAMGRCVVDLGRVERVGR
jgi:hypothetical protein